MKKLIIACFISGIGSNAMSQDYPNLPIHRPIDGFISFGTENVIKFKESSPAILTVKENGQILRGETPIDQLPAEELIKIIKELINKIRN